MALTDINFQEGEAQDFTLELGTATYSGTLTDVLTEPNSSQFLMIATPVIVGGGGGGNIFVISD
jgi:hypothetical protein